MSESENPEAGTDSQFLLAEYSSLQFARSQTISESNGRLSSYLTVLSATIVSLAFVVQVSGNTALLAYFVLLLVPVTFFLGVTSAARIIQLGVAEVIYVRGMNRIRRFFGERSAGIQPYLVLPMSDDPPGLRQAMFISSGFSENFLGAPVIIGLINSLLAAVFGGLIGSLLTEINAFLNGAACFLLSLALHGALGKRFAMTLFENAGGLQDVRFPASPD